MTTIHKTRTNALLALATLAALAVGCGKTAERAPNEFTDSRDGQTYRTVKIGTQTWMAENLNFATDSSVCYENKKSNCKKYGRLYDWDDAMKACPAGWHLPSDAEWDSLALAVGGVLEEDGDYYWEYAGKKLKSKNGWRDNGNGTDDYGFSALPGGTGRSDGGFYDVGDNGNWWSATEYVANAAWCRDMNFNNDVVGRDGNLKTYLFSLRCSQD